jgi:hypothetical protein
VKTIKNYKHKVASHCESGIVRNLLNFNEVDVSEALVFGIGAGIDFVYLNFLKYFSPFPLTIARSQMGKIFKNIEKLCNVNFFYKQLKSTDKAINKINNLIDSDIPVAVCVDMFYMKYLPPFMHIHVPFHFVTLYGRDENNYAVSDPYYQNVATITVDTLRTAISTHAMFSKDNLVTYIVNVPKNINWNEAIINGLKRTCNKMLPPAFLNAYPILGVSGIKTFAKKILDWPNEYKGIPLREGIIFTATGFEEQGTGGGAFRLIYGAFLQEASKILNIPGLADLAGRMVENGKEWREASRKLIKIGKDIPKSNKVYPEWYQKNKKNFIKSLSEVSNDYIKRAEVEKEIFTDLKKILKNIK